MAVSAVWAVGEVEAGAGRHSAAVGVPCTLVAFAAVSIVVIFVIAVSAVESA